MIIREASLPEVWQLRQEVMYPNASIAVVQLEDDLNGIHLGLYDGEHLITVVSLFISDRTLQFRKFATHINYQHKGFGTTMLQYVLEWAKASNCTLVWCNARMAASQLYKRFGMEQVGQEWMKNGIEYIKMQKEL